MTDLTRRGVLWLGMKCDVRCSFCYQENMPSSIKRWVPAEDLELALTKFRGYYQNEFVDFMGGEPTYHPEIERIVGFSAGIGLKPTIITHGMRLADRAFATRLKNAGVHDFLVSVHGIGATLQAIHRRGKDNFERQQQGLENLRALGIPFRFNVTVIKDNLDELPALADFAIASGARVVNFLTFNPYFEWSAEEEIPFQVSHSDAAPRLRQAIDRLTSSGIEANVRYFPLCVLEGYERHVFNGFQLPYDVHEWDYNAWYDQGHPGRPDSAWYLNASREQRLRNGYVHPPACEPCSLKAICDGVHEQYFARFGDAELKPRMTTSVTDPTHFVELQPHVLSLPVGATPALRDELRQPLPLTQFRADLRHRAGIAVVTDTVEPQAT